jgi:two-component sensor histidine kinase
MRHLLLTLSFLATLCCAKANINYDEFYLTDSTFTETLSLFDKNLLKTKLALYHKSKNDSVKIKLLFDIVEYCEDTELMPIYNRIIIESLNTLLSSGPVKKQKEALYKMLASAYNNKGFYHQGNGNPTIALENYFKALKIQLKINNIEGQVNTYVNIGSTYYSIKHSKKALSYFLKAHSKKDDIKNLELKAFILNNIGVIYSDQGEIPKSLRYQFEGLEIRQNLDDTFGIAMSYNNIGGSYSNMDSLDKGMDYLHNSLDLFLKINEARWISLTYWKIGSSYFKLNKNDKALFNGEKAIEFGYKSKQIDAIKRAERLISKIYKREGHHKKALEHYQIYVSLKDSISNEKNRIEGLKKEFEFENEKEKELAKKEKEKIIAIANAEKQRQKIINYSFIIGLALTLIFLLFIINRLLTSRKQNAIIQKQSDERKLLLKEIHHRVKNNFQIISSILRLQANDDGNPKIKVAFDDAINRIHSMATVHELIYRNELFTEIETKEYLERLVNSLDSYNSNKDIEFIIESEGNKLNFETLIPLGITINELITNSFKYAFNESIKNPKISISLTKKDNLFLFIYKDNGIGLNPEIQKTTFGMELIDTIINQIEGELKASSSEEWKNTISISFKN